MSASRGLPWLKSLVGLALLAGIGYYGLRSGEALREMPSVGAATWFWAFVITAVGTSLSARSVQRMLAAIGTETPYREMFLLHNAAHLLNLLPMKAGTVLRAEYLRARYDFSLAQFAVFALYLGLLTALVTSAVGLVGLIVVYGVGTEARRLVAAILAASIVGIATVLFVPIPVPAWGGRLGRTLRKLVESRRTLLASPAALLGPALLVLSVYLLGALRLGVIYRGLGLEVHPAGLLLLGAMAQLSMLVNLTPGGLGVRELVLGGSATVLGVTVEEGLVAALIERAVALSWLLVVGLPSAAWIWRRRVVGTANDLESPDPPLPGSI